MDLKGNFKGAFMGIPLFREGGKGATCRVVWGLVHLNDTFPRLLKF